MISNAYLGNSLVLRNVPSVYFRLMTHFPNLNADSIHRLYRENPTEI